MQIGSGLMVETNRVAATKVQAVISRFNYSWYLIGALVLGLLLAKWTWVLLAPSNLSVIPTISEATVSTSATLFGELAASAVEKSSSTSVASNLRLVGVFTGKNGFAVFKLDDKKQVGVALGEELSQGNRLVALAADHVLLESHGVRQRVNLEVGHEINTQGIVGNREVQASLSDVSEAANSSQSKAEVDRVHQDMMRALEMAQNVQASNKAIAKDQ